MTTVTDKPAGAKKRLAGMAYVRETEAWQTACLLQSAVREAESVCADIYRAVNDAYQPSDGDKSAAASVAGCFDIHEKAREARALLEKAFERLNALTSYDQDPPW